MAQVSTTRYFKLSNLASDLTTSASTGRPVLSLLTGKRQVAVMLESKPSAEESLISVMISYY